MYPLISKWTILPGNESIAVYQLKLLAEKVKLREPDTLVYLVNLPNFEETNLPTPAAGEVVFFEIYKDKMAFEAHVKGPVFTEFVRDYGSLFLCSNALPYVTLELLNYQAGFIRFDKILFP